jgi:hypothetical protein
VLTFDPRSFGESDGQPRCYYDPTQVIGHYANDTHNHVELHDQHRTSVRRPPTRSTAGPPPEVRPASGGVTSMVERWA